MSQIEIEVKDRNVSITSCEGKKISWRDNANISKNFLAKFDKINNYNKHRVNCFFSHKSDPLCKPRLIVLKRLGGESTTWRIVLVALRALKWTGRICLTVREDVK